MTREDGLIVKRREYRGIINFDLCEERPADFGIRNRVVKEADRSG